MPTAPGTGLLTNYGQDFGASGRDGAIDRSARVGYSQQWNLNVQRELPGKFSLEAAYVGNKGTKLTDGPLGPQLNQLTTDQLQLGNQLLQQVPNPFSALYTDRRAVAGNGDPRATAAPVSAISESLRFPPGHWDPRSITPSRRGWRSDYSQGLTLLASFTGGKLIEDTSQTVAFLAPRPRTRTSTTAAPAARWRRKTSAVGWS